MAEDDQVSPYQNESGKGSKDRLQDFQAAWLAYAAEVNGIGATLREDLEKAYKEYIRAVQEAATATEAQEKLQDAQRTHATRVQEAIQGGLGGCSDDAFRSYVKALQQAWANVNAAEITLAELWCIANSILWAVYWRCSSAGQWRVSGLWSGDPAYVLLSRTGPVVYKSGSAQNP